MTENAVIKALEEEIHLAKYVDSSCCNNVELTLIKCALNLINRKNAEIESLKAHEEKEHQYCKNECEPKHKAELKEANRIRCRLIEASGVLTKISDELYQKIKAAAIKEFWGKLKEQNTMDVRIVSVASGDNLVKEMTGGLNNG